MAGEVDPDDQQRRRVSAVPSEFAPIAPLGSAGPQRPPARAPGEPPRLRLTASASRRHSPDRSLTTPAPRAVEVVADVPQVAVPAHRAGRGAKAAGIAVVLVALVGAAMLLRPTREPGAGAASAATTRPAAQTASAFDPPTTLPPDSEYVETEVVDETDDLLVTHWISTTSPMDRLRLRPPSTPGLDGLAVDVEDLVVVADGVPLTVDDLRVDVPHALPSARRLYVRYRLVHALQLDGSVQGRALATVTSLGIGLEGRLLDRIQAFPGGRVLTLACLGQGARAVPESCGTHEEDLWRVESPGGDVPVLVVAQLDLAVTR